MSDARDSAAFRSLRFAGGVAIAALVVSLVMVGGSWWHWDREKKLANTSKRDLSAASTRLETIKRERDDLLGSEETYKRLVARGVFAPEMRMDFIETMADLKKRNGILALDYEVLPQRSLKFATGISYPSAEIRASRIRMKFKALHDADLVAFLDEFPRIGRGFFPIDRCVLKRPVTRSSGPEGPLSGNLTQAQIAPVRDAEEAQAAISVAKVHRFIDMALEADCSLEWITLVDKNPEIANTQVGPAGRPKS
ncbi:MAG: hypothetical protein JNJ55_13610 [Betaproteobacteria bacterium]|nr:hypothetical protein [Betaproteobacteria bacterium]